MTDILFVVFYEMNPYFINNFTLKKYHKPIMKATKMLFFFYMSVYLSRWFRFGNCFGTRLFIFGIQSFKSRVFPDSLCLGDDLERPIV